MFFVVYHLLKYYFGVNSAGKNNDATFFILMQITNCESSSESFQKSVQENSFNDYYYQYKIFVSIIFLKNV